MQHFWEFQIENYFLGISRHFSQQPTDSDHDCTSVCCSNKYYQDCGPWCCYVLPSLIPAFVWPIREFSLLVTRKCSNILCPPIRSFLSGSYYVPSSMILLLRSGSAQCTALTADWLTSNWKCQPPDWGVSWVSSEICREVVNVMEKRLIVCNWFDWSEMRKVFLGFDCEVRWDVRWIAMTWT